MSERSERVVGIKAIGYGLLLGIALLYPQFGKAAFGISPAVITMDHLVPGSEFTQTLYLVQDKPDDDLPVTATFDIPSAVRGWISIEQGESFTIPRGKNQFPVRITVKVPKGISLGSWSGKVSFVSNPQKTGQVTIALGAQAILNLRVGNDAYEKFSVPLIKLLDVEEGWDPRVYVKFQNEGNIPNGFTNATYELFDKFGEVRLAYVQKGDGFPETPAFTTKEYTMDFPIDFHLGIGQYWATVTFYKNDAVVASQRTVFNVLEKGSLAASPFATLFEFVKKHGASSAGVGAFLFIILILLARFSRKRKRA
jgi:hypothetical protein